MSDKSKKLNSSSESQNGSLTIFDAPNVCREMLARCETLATHPDPEVAKAANEIAADAKKMLDAIVASVDQLLASAA